VTSDATFATQTPSAGATDQDTNNKADVGEIDIVWAWLPEDIPRRMASHFKDVQSPQDVHDAYKRFSAETEGLQSFSLREVYKEGFDAGREDGLWEGREDSKACCVSHTTFDCFVSWQF
jgi:hypothetical protein